MNNNESDKFVRMHQGNISAFLSRYQLAVDAYINPSIIEDRKLNVARESLEDGIVDRHTLREPRNLEC